MVPRIGVCWSKKRVVKTILGSSTVSSCTNNTWHWHVHQRGGVAMSAEHQAAAVIAESPEMPQREQNSLLTTPVRRTRSGRRVRKCSFVHISPVHSLRAVCPSPCVRTSMFGSNLFAGSPPPPDPSSTSRAPRTFCPLWGCPGFCVQTSLPRTRATLNTQNWFSPNVGI